MRLDTLHGCQAVVLSYLCSTTYFLFSAGAGVEREVLFSCGAGLVVTADDSRDPDDVAEVVDEGIRLRIELQPGAHRKTQLGGYVTGWCVVGANGVTTEQSYQKAVCS